MKTMFFTFVVIVLIGFTSLAIITGKAISLSWEANHTDPFYFGTCVVYVILIAIMLFIAIWVVYSASLEAKFKKEFEAIEVQKIPQLAF